MNLIPRHLQKIVTERLLPNKAVLIYGARRVGKTVLLRSVLQEFSGRILSLNGEDYDAQTLLATRSIANYRQLLAGVDLLTIDEAQNIPQIGNVLKLIVDEIPGIKVLATGSSSFDLLNKIGEPLVGRASQLHLSAFSQLELSSEESLLATRQNLDNRLIYGSYPDVVALEANDRKEEYLREIVNAYLLKDILSVDGIKNANKMRDLLRLVAFQTGSEVSYDELGRQLGISKNTVEKYLSLLEKVFVVYRLGAFSRNLRKEVTKAGKWYFCDNGIRNALIGAFAPFPIRQDVGALWENYLIGEMRKNAFNTASPAEFYFWRTYDGQEVDLIRETNGTIDAFEFKWGAKRPSPPTAFASAYPQATYQVVNRDNYLDLLIGQPSTKPYQQPRH